MEVVLLCLLVLVVFIVPGCYLMFSGRNPRLGAYSIFCGLGLYVVIAIQVIFN